MWCIACEHDGAFVARMEHVLEVHARSYDARLPVVCMDEQPFQLLSEGRSLVFLGAGRGRLVDYEYVREGTCTVWMFVEPLGCWREARVTRRRTALEWAEQIRALVDAPRYAGAERITLVCDNLNTHDFGSLYTAFEPSEAKRIMDRLEFGIATMGKPPLSIRDVTASQASANAALSVSYVRAFAPREASLSFDQHDSIGDKSDEYGGKYTT